ncbi:3-hydroxyacyl-CoA dehydrogenase [Litchfieldella xinjiangensis]|uniref:3-hydroxyacyl-CoA dehydrogenase n=1 Tax=Litchfieldella xinjiangensis TaxID=1166948 RepID=UPI0006941775|nr:3-hydroxyacyl-CoA dehydrogenase [Halomonas xinjiangensis]
MKGMDSSEITLGVVGAGAMGGGIAQVAAAAGIRTRLHDARQGAAAETCEKIRDRFAKRVTAGKMSAEEANVATANLLPVAGLNELADCDVVIEAIVEKLEVKTALFKELEELVREDAILASNTSSLPIGAIAAGLKRRDRVAGMHFFNPVPAMKLVEVIQAADTSAVVMDALIELGGRLGRVPVVVKDTPGFLVNFGGRAYTTEALAIVHEGVATPAQVDAIMRDCFGFRMGPFELMDLTGMDVNFPVTRFVHENFFGDPRLRSTPLHRYMLETGQLGRKTGQGFYDHSDGAVTPSTDAEVNAPPAEAIFVHSETPKLSRLIEACGARVLVEDDGQSPVLAAPVGEDASAYAVRNGIDHRRLVCVDTVSDCEQRVTIMAAPGHDAEMVATVVACFAQKRQVSLIGDSPGFVGQRIAAMVANLGCEMAQMGLAKIDDIDLALRLGLNYPYGPLELADHLGSKVTYRILEQAQLLSGDDRYRPSQWLRRRAQLGLSARTG